jgi:DNA repair protein RadC
MTIQRKPRKMMSEELFNRVKSLIALDAMSHEDIGKLKNIGLSQASVSRVAHYSSFTEMRDEQRRLNKESLERVKARKATLQNEISDANKKEQIENEETINIKDNAADKVETELTATYELNRIANALERLADAWEAQPKKRSLF